MISKVTHIINETKKVKTLRFDWKLSFIPGQFVMLQATLNGELIKRAYSIASAPNEFLELTIELTPEGKLTPFIHNEVNVGDEFEISEPIGKFTLTDEKKVALVAGGSGVVPFMSMIRHASKLNLDVEIILFYSIKTFDDIIYYNELEKFLSMNSNLRVIYTLTKEAPDEWKGKTGRLSLSMMLEDIDNYKDYVFYVCGPMEMVKFFSEELKPLGVKLKRELWG